ncbi:MAG: DUF2157 domain-containing protein [Pseudomonadota bacterium]
MRNRIERQINDWLKRGVVDEATADVLIADVRQSASVSDDQQTQKQGFSFFKVLVGFAALSFVAGILLFIAANWDAIPRLAKVAGIAALIVGGFLSGSLLRTTAYARQAAGGSVRYAAFLEEVLYTIGGSAYVGGVALVGQMYHLPGSLDKAMFGFAVGLTVSGALVRSRMVILGALVCAVWWYLGSNSPANLFSVNFVLFAGMAAAGMFTAQLRQDRLLRRACFLALLLGFGPFVFTVLDAVFDAYRELPLFVKLLLWHALLLASVAMMWLHRYRSESVPVFAMRFLGVGRSFVLGLVAVMMLHFVWSESLLLIVPIGYGVVFSVFSLVVHGANHRLLRYAAYMVFVVEIAILFGDTIIGLLNSSVVLIVLSAVLAALAYFFYRIERRFNSETQVEGNDV